ncbi:MAG: endonuclease domain-containing protein [Elusimicrobia bacterium]|nr:endonuclease domain-containing protein [Elusimicrobiota bacterium]
MRGRARQLRQNWTDAENKFWRLLRLRNIGGYKFRRQHPIGPYIVDFCCLKKRLVIELDGGQHARSIGYDRQRTEFLQARGYRVMRVWDNEALTNADGVLEKVLEILEEKPLTLPSPRFTGRGKEPDRT